MKGFISVLLLASLSTSAFSDDIEDKGEYTVTASLTPVSKAAVGSAVTIITSEDIEKRGLLFLPDILREVPGLSVVRSGTFGTQTQVRARGAEANHTLVLIDGIEVNDPAFGSEFAFANLTADNIERVEVLRGAQSALWGSDAIGAVINIITKKGKGPLEVRAAYEGGSFATNHTTFGGAYGNDLFNFNLNAEVLGTNGANIARSGDEDDSHNNRVYDLKLGMTPNEYIDINYVRRVVKAVTQTDPSVSGIVTDATGNQTNSDQFYQKGTVSLSLFDGKWRNTASFQTSKNRSDFQSSTFGASFLDGDKDKYAFQSDVSFDTNRLTSIEHNASFLFEYEDDNAAGSFIGGRNQVGFLTKSYVGEYRVSIADRFFVSTGLRHDDTDDFFEDTNTYRVTGAYNLIETGSRLHMSYGTGVKNPTVSELFGNFPTFTGNPNLTPESSRGWDVGVEQSLFNDQLSFDVTYFRNLITDLITGQNNTVTNSVGTNSIQGLEMAFSYSPVYNLDINGGYTFTNSRDANQFELVRRPKHMGNININYSFLNQKANLNLGVNYNGRQKNTVFATPQFRANLGAYTLVNLAASYKFSDAISFSGRIENLLDESYEEVFSFTNPGIAGFLGINLALNP